MTTSIRVICDGNTEGDEITLWHGRTPDTVQEAPEGQTLLRGEMSDRISVGDMRHGQDLWIHVNGMHGKGKSLGDLDIIAADRAYHNGDLPAPGTFGWAIFMLKHGHRVQRRGWEGKGMYLWLHSGLIFDSDGSETSKPFIVMHTATGEEQPGWLASQPDMLEEDWEQYDG